MPLLPDWARQQLLEGIVIPAHPLALNHARQYDPDRQRALTRYYHAAGAGGIAVGVHTTQFCIRDPQYNLLRPVLSLARETVETLDAATGRQTVCIAGLCGPTQQAVAEAELAASLGYQAGLLSLGALRDAPEQALVDHCAAVAKNIPLFGFYLQPAAGGRLLSFNFWRRFLDIPGVIGIKVAPFNRYQTLDVLRAVAESGRAEEVALYTGNDDNIVLDLLTEHHFHVASGKLVKVQFRGGLLGHWACWTKLAVELLARCKAARQQAHFPAELLALATQVTDCNAALFDAANHFKGCIAGIQEVLRRQGLLETNLCLDPEERLSPGQKEEIDRVEKAYPHLTDTEFVRANLGKFLAVA